MNRAYFVKYPRVIEELTGLHILSDERGYEIVKTVALAAIDYENFITDMSVDREFLEEAAGLCSEGEPMKCIFVRQKGRRDGVLVVPEYGSFVKWAAAGKAKSRGSRELAEKNS